jgi:glycosyltransferase involved in cell wall biosynthesis
VKRRLIYFCNALDDRTRLERKITTDSPAASKKVFMLANAVKCQGIYPIILSLGRGRQNGSGKFFKKVVRRVNGVPVIYLPFINIPFLSELLSIIASFSVVNSLLPYRKKTVMLYYNANPFYILSLFFASIFGFKNVLDLEDGYFESPSFKVSYISNKIVNLFYNFFCQKMLLACSALEDLALRKKTYCYYGIVEKEALKKDWRSPKIVALFGGTVSPETGAEYLLGVIEKINQEKPAWASQLSICVTGKGDCLERFNILEKENNYLDVKVWGRTTNLEYQAILNRCHIGLALKLVNGSLADTTFPSKVIEFAGAGLLVMSTDISDVKKIFGKTIVYVDDEEVSSLFNELKAAVLDRVATEMTVLKGVEKVHENCGKSLTGQKLTEFLFDTLR